MTVEGLDPSDLVVPGSFPVAAWLFWRLFMRSDQRERDAFREVKEQRETYRLKNEVLEEALRTSAEKVARLEARVLELEQEAARGH